MNTTSFETHEVTLESCTDNTHSKITNGDCRDIPFALRGGFRDGMKNALEHHSKMAAAYRPLVEQQRSDGGYLSCPLCQTNEHVKSGGTQKDGTRKFRCCNNHSGNTTVSSEHFVIKMHESWKGNFSTFTSFEAYNLYRRLLVETIVLFIKTNSTESGLSSYLGISKDFIGMALSLALQVLQDEKIKLKMDGEGDFVLTFFDYSGCVLSRRLSLVLAKVNGQLIWKIVCGSNRLTIWNFLKTIKESVDKAWTIQGKDEEIKYIFITDGEISFVDPVGSLFPDSIHIRQFHKKELRGLVYTHFPSSVKITGEEIAQDRNQRYTISCPWNLVLEEGKPNGRTLAQRKRRKREEKATKKKETKHHDWGIKIWPYVKYTHRFPASPKKQVSRQTHKRSEKTIDDDGDHKPFEKKATTLLSRSDTELARVKVDEKCETQTKQEKTTSNPAIEKSPEKTSTYGYALRKKGKRKRRVLPDPLVFESIAEAKKNSIFLHIFNLLAFIFGGLYIQSNNVENGFNVKVALKPHRVMKTGSNLLRLILHCQLQLKSKSTAELRKYFCDRIAPEMIMNWIPPHNEEVSEAKRKKDEIARLISEAHKTQQILAITYRDRYRRLTRRGIQVQEYNDEYIGAHCFLRGEHRTFRIDRISYAYVNDNKPLIFLTT